MRAARSSGRAVVAFDRGRLDGVPATSEYAQAFGVALKRARIEEVLASDVALEPAFQPIVSLDGVVRGYEALARFHVDPHQGPDRWIQDAYDADMGLELEAECVHRALGYLEEVPHGTYLSVNVSPDLVLSPLFHSAVGTGRLDGVVFEITEHKDVADYAVLADCLALLRGRGAAVAIDDVGAGFSSMRHVMKLRPDYVKVDRWMVDGINLDSAKRALMRSLAALAEELHAGIVAEGVETLDELLVLQDIGVDACQGYLFARPRHSFATLDDMPREVLEVITPGRVAAELAPVAPVAPAAAKA
jgi:EAL domain-containing protein (putative c-di-GMP-specific phosphodiesterase class I)